MRLSVAKKVAALLVGLILSGLATDGAATVQRPVPQPVLVFVGQEVFASNGKQFTRYRFTVDNRADYPAHGLTSMRRMGSGSTDSAPSEAATISTKYGLPSKETPSRRAGFTLS